MNASVPYILIAVLALLILVGLAYATFRSRRPGRITPLAGLAFAFILAGIVLGDNGLISYGLMGVGVVFAIIDIVNKSRGPVG